MGGVGFYAHHASMSAHHIIHSSTHTYPSLLTHMLSHLVIMASLLSHTITLSTMYGICICIVLCFMYGIHICIVFVFLSTIQLCICNAKKCVCVCLVYVSLCGVSHYPRTNIILPKNIKCMLCYSIIQFQCK